MKTQILFTLVLTFGMMSASALLAQTDNFPGIALEFDGSDDYVSVLSAASFNTPEFTVEFWIKPNPLTEPCLIIGLCGAQQTNWLITCQIVAQDKIIAFEINEGSGSNQIDLSWQDTLWHHVAGIYNGSSMKLFLDGALQSETSSNYSFVPEDLFIGSFKGTDHYFKGSLDEVALWDAALPDYIIPEFMNQTYPDFGESLISYWQFNEGSGTLAADAISGNNGILNNMTDEDWIVSTIPVGGGESNSQTVSTTGNVVFTNTSLEMDFTAKTGSDDIVVTRIDLAPNILPSGISTTFDQQYWVVKKYGTGTFGANLTFTISEGLTQVAENNPTHVKLYTRESNSEGAWTLLTTAESVDAANNTATFNGITSFSQFIICSDIMFAQGNINADTTWSGTVAVEGDVFIENGNTLNIEPGTLIEFQGHYKLDVQGRLLAIGTESDSITFTAADHNTGWNRIVFDDTPAANDSSKIVFCRLEYGKSMDNPGGALCVDAFDKLLISNSTFSNNYADHWGGAIYCYEASVLIKFCEISNNHGGYLGSGICISTCDPSLLNNLIRNNSGGDGGIYFGASNALVLNNTIVNNNEGIHCKNNSDPVIKNTIIYNNNWGDYQVFLDGNNNDPNFYYCNIQGGVSGFVGSGSGVNFSGDYLNSIDVNPQFVQSGDHPFDIEGTSPCINTGDPATTTNDVGSYDLSGDTRILNGRIDIGAYETFISNLIDPFPGYTLEFQGGNEYVHCLGDDRITGNNPRTIEAWAYTESFNRGGIFQTGITGTNLRDFSFRTNETDNNWRVQLYGNDMDVYLPGSLNSWHHYCLTYDGTTVKFYYDGKLKAAGERSLNTGSGDIYFGKWKDDYFDGRIDEVRIWDKALTITEIRKRMHLTLDGSENNLLSYWQFNEGTGATTADFISNNDGALNNMDTGTCWQESEIPVGGGISETKVVSNTGPADFSFTGVQMNLIEKNGTDTIVVSRIDRAPNLNPENVEEVFDAQYWVVNKFGNGTFSADITFSINENLNLDDEIYPACIKLYSRQGNAIADWIYKTSASTVDATNNQASFHEITEFSQFITTRGYYPNIAVNKNNIAFGPLYLENSKTDSLTIYNSGNDTLSVLDISNLLPDFTPGISSCEISPGDSCKVMLTFSPTHSGVFTDTLKITSNDPDEEIIEILLSGERILEPDISVDVDLLDFGQVMLGQTTTETITIQNTGNDTLSVTDISNNNPDFLPETTNCSVMPGESYELNISFSPSSRELIMDTQFISSNDPDEAIVQVTLTGEGVATDAFPGNALSFDGIDDYVDLDQNNGLPIYYYDANRKFTICIWVKGGLQDEKVIFCEGYSDDENPEFSIGTSSEGKVKIFVRTLYGSVAIDQVSENIAFDGNWHHIAWVDVNLNQVLYIDGVPDPANFNYSRAGVALDNTTIGAKNGGSISHEFGGMIDEVQVYKIDLSEMQVRERMHTTLTGTEFQLVSYLQFNEGSGSTTYDYINQNNGTLKNMDNTKWVESGAIWKRWEGDAKSTDWNTAGNWSTTFSPPTANDFVLIQPGATQAIISNDAETPAVCDKLKIESSAILTLSAGKALTVSDSILNEAGTSGLVLKSIGTATASLIHETSEVDATVERYIPKYAGAAGWHYISSPIASQAIQPGFVADPPNSSDDFYKFSEPDYLWLSAKDNSGNWNSSFEDNFVVGRGYNVAYAENETKTFAGKLNVGDFTFNASTIPAITHTTDGGIGWNLLGNPYASALDWNLCSRTNIDASVYVYDGDAGQYVSWNGSIGALNGGIIPAMNAFFIKASANPELTIPNSARTHAANNFYKEKEYVEDLLVLKVEGNGFSDKTFIHFNENATLNFDAEFDAYKLSGISEAPQLYTKAGDSKLSINVLPYTSEEITIPLCLKVGNETEYKISVNENSFWETVDVSLKDLETGNICDLRTNIQLMINHSPNSSPDRFLLLINGATGIQENQIEDDGIEIYAYGNQIFIKTDEPGEVQVGVYNLLGQIILHRTLSGFGNLSGLNPGFYLVSVRTDEAMKVEKFFVR